MVGGVGSQLGGVRLRGRNAAHGLCHLRPGSWGAPDLVQNSLSEGDRLSGAGGRVALRVSPPSWGHSASALSRALGAHLCRPLAEKNLGTGFGTLERPGTLGRPSLFFSLHVAFRGGLSIAFVFFAPVYFYFPKI